MKPPSSNVQRILEVWISIQLQNSGSNTVLGRNQSIQSNCPVNRNGDSSLVHRHNSTTGTTASSIVGPPWLTPWTPFRSKLVRPFGNKTLRFCGSPKGWKSVIPFLAYDFSKESFSNRTVRFDLCSAKTPISKRPTPIAAICPWSAVMKTRYPLARASFRIPVIGVAAAHRSAQISPCTSIFPHLCPAPFARFWGYHFRS